jgi:hypothetical protein
MKRLLPFIALIVVFFAGIVSLVLVLNPEHHRAEITGFLSGLLRRPVVIGRLSMDYFPPTLRLGKLAVMKEDGSPFFEIETASAPLLWPALLHLKFAPSSLELDRWKLVVLRKADGRWDSEDWRAGLPGNSAASALLTQVLWKDGEIRWVDPFANAVPDLVLSALAGSWSLKEGSISAHGDFSGLGSVPTHLTLSAKGKFVSSPQWSGDLQLTHRGDSCAVHIDDKAGDWEAKGASTQWSLANALSFAKFYGRATVKTADRAGSLELSNWQFHVSKRSSEMSFEHSAGISSGRIESTGTLKMEPGGLLVHASGAAKDIPAEAFWAAAGQDVPLSGRITFLAQEVQLAFSTGSVTFLSGQGYWELNGGRYNVPSVSLKRLARAKTMAYVKKKFSDLDTAGLPVERLSAHWRAQDGLVTVEDGLLVSTDLKAGWAGKLDPARRGIDVTVRLDLHEKNPKLLALVPSRYQTRPAFGRLQGTWQEWTLRALRPAKIPSALQSKLRRAVNQK